MNLDSRGGCHAAPTLGGASPAENPQCIFFNDNLKNTNRMPPFITENGPVREVRNGMTGRSPGLAQRRRTVAPDVFW